MGEQSQPSQPATPVVPKFGKSIKQGIEAYAEELPTLYASQAEWGPQFLNLKLADIAATSDANAASALDVAETYGARFVQNQLALKELADPIGMALRKELGMELQDQLALGTDLPEDLQHEIIQQFRMGREERGGGFGDEDSILEAMTVGRAGLELQDRRQRMAAAFLGLPTPESSFAPVSAASRGAAPFMPMTADAMIDPNAGRYAAEFAQTSTSRNFQWAEHMYDNTLNWGLEAPDYWMEGLGMVAGIIGQVGGSAAGGAAMGAAMCWVAAEIFGGWNLPETEAARFYVTHKAPRPFREFYQENGRAIAELVRRSAKLRAALRPIVEDFARAGAALIKKGG